MGCSESVEEDSIEPIFQLSKHLYTLIEKPETTRNDIERFLDHVQQLHEQGSTLAQMRTNIREKSRGKYRRGGGSSSDESDDEERYAAYYNDDEKVPPAASLITAQIDIISKRGKLTKLAESALHGTAKQGRADIFSLFFTKYKAGMHALHGNLTSSEILVNEKNSLGHTPLHLCFLYFKEPQSIQCAELLLREGANVNLTNPEGNTCLHLACTHGSSEAVSFLLKKGASSDIANAELRKPKDILLKVLADRDAEEEKRQQILQKQKEENEKADHAKSSSGALKGKSPLTWSSGNNSTSTPSPKSKFSVQKSDGFVPSSSSAPLPLKTYTSNSNLKSANSVAKSPTGDGPSTDSPSGQKASKWRTLQATTIMMGTQRSQSRPGQWISPDEAMKSLQLFH